MDRNIQKNGLVNLIILAVIAVVDYAIARHAQTLAGQVAAAFMGTGVLVALVVYFQMRLEERERIEKLEYDELAKSPSGSALFTSQEADTYPARRSREQFEKWFVPAFTLLLMLGLGGGAVYLLKWLKAAAPTTVLSQSMIGPSVFGLSALALFLFGKYSANLGRLGRERLLPPAANLLLLNAYLAIGVTMAVVLVVFGGFRSFDLRVAQALCGLMVLVAVELLITLVLEIYRPRIKGKVGRLVYDSRLIGLLAQPESLFTTAAQALDYQFGFKVSETWFYRFLERSLSWIILSQIGILLLSTCLVFIEPGEQGLLERFGKPPSGRALLDPGLHFKLPWPISRVYRENTQRIQNFYIGYVPDDGEDANMTIRWDVAHYKGNYDFLVASRDATNASTTATLSPQSVPANLLSVSIPIHYQITNLLAWAYHHKDPAQLLERIATREVVRYLVSQDLFDIMSTRRAEGARELQQLIQARANQPGSNAADSLGLGVKIIFVGLQDIHPPVKVAAAFQDVVGARQDKEAAIETARGYQAALLPTAQAEARRVVNEAEAQRVLKVSGAIAQAGRFTNQLTAFNASRTVFTERTYLNTLAQASTNARKYILMTTNTHDVLLLNLEDKLRPGLDDIVVPPSKRR